jgi:XisI protein
MDKSKVYRELIHNVLTEYRNLETSDDGLETVALFDDVQNHYLLLRTGWDGSDRIERMVIHVRLKNDKIWIEEDATEEGVATDFLQAGVPRDDIVLAFHPQHLRQYTEFAIA